jgi:hypothetical protein
VSNYYDLALIDATTICRFAIQVRRYANEYQTRIKNEQRDNWTFIYPTLLQEF